MWGLSKHYQPTDNTSRTLDSTGSGSNSLAISIWHHAIPHILLFTLPPAAACIPIMQELNQQSRQSNLSEIADGVSCIKTNMINNRDLPFAYLDLRCIAFPWGIQIVCGGWVVCTPYLDCNRGQMRVCRLESRKNIIISSITWSVKWDGLVRNELINLDSGMLSWGEVDNS